MGKNTDTRKTQLHFWGKTYLLAVAGVMSIAVATAVAQVLVGGGSDVKVQSSGTLPPQGAVAQLSPSLPTSSEPTDPRTQESQTPVPATEVPMANPTRFAHGWVKAVSGNTLTLDSAGEKISVSLTSDAVITVYGNPASGRKDQVIQIAQIPIDSLAQVTLKSGSTNVATAVYLTKIHD